MVGLSADADKSAWPLLPSERDWGAWRLAIALGTAATATWCYIIGEYVGYYLNFRQGSAALADKESIRLRLHLRADCQP